MICTKPNTVTYDFIFNSLAEEAASLGNHTPRGVADVNTCGKKAPESGVKGAGGEIFTLFYPNWFKLLEGEKIYIFDERKQINIKGVGKCKSFNKKKQSRDASIKYKKKAAQKIQREISYLKSKCKELEEKMNPSE